MRTKIILLVCFFITVFLIGLYYYSNKHEYSTHNKLALTEPYTNNFDLKDSQLPKSPNLPQLSQLLKLPNLIGLAKNPEEIVFKYVNLPLDYSYGSNSIPLAVAAYISSGELLELGMGMFSTPILHRVAVDLKRKLISVDTIADWVSKFKGYNSSDYHKLYYIPGDENIHNYGLDREWGMVLVDHKLGETRYKDVIAFAEKAKIVVLHDAEKMAEGGYKYEHNKIRSHYKYACKYSIYTDTKKSNYVSTILLSNFIDLDKLESIFDRISTDYGHVACDVNM